MKNAVATTTLLAALLALGCVPPKTTGTVPAIATSDTEPLDEATAKLFTPSNDRAVMYIYRPWRFGGGGMTPFFQLNETNVAPLENGRFMRVAVPEGHYAARFGFAGNFDTHELDVKAGQVYFFRVSIQVGFFVGSPKMYDAKPDDAKPEIEKMKMVDNPYNR